MGRWIAKGSQRNSADIVAASSSTSFRAEKNTSLLHQHPCSKSPSEEPSLCATVACAAEDIAEEARVFLQACSLSDAQRAVWQSLVAAVEESTPAPEETKRGPPSPQVLAAMQSARKAQDAFMAELPCAQQEEVLQHIELKKRERKLRSKEVMARSKVERHAELEVQNLVDSEGALLKERQKEVMARAFWLYQKDRQQQEGNKHVDSTEWKRIRALGGQNATLRHYLERAGWEVSWPLPEPEGRLLRREGQDAALRQYSRSKPL